MNSCGYGPLSVKAKVERGVERAGGHILALSLFMNGQVTRVNWVEVGS